MADGNKFQDLLVQVARISTLVGESASDGMRKEIADMKNSLQLIERRIYMALGGLLVISTGIELLLRK